MNMSMEMDPLEPWMQKAVDAGVSGIDIIHGHLKSLISDCESNSFIAQAEEAMSPNDMNHMESRYWEGQLDALTAIYNLTYSLAFAINNREGRSG